MNNLFRCPHQLPPSSLSTPTPSLAHLITYTLHRTRRTSSVTFAALYFLQRLKTRFIAACGSSGHRLFISAFMVARQLNVEPGEFESMIWRDIKVPGPYPAHYTLPQDHSPTRNRVQVTSLSFGPGAPPSPPSATTPTPPEKSSQGRRWIHIRHRQMSPSRPLLPPRIQTSPPQRTRRLQSPQRTQRLQSPCQTMKATTSHRHIIAFTRASPLRRSDYKRTLIHRHETYLPTGWYHNVEHWL